MAHTKVIEYIPTMYDGGAETLVKDYALLLDRNQFDVAIVVTESSKDSANLRRIRQANIRVIPVYRHWNIFVRGWNHFFGRYYVPFRLKRILKQEKPDVLHTHMLLLKNVCAISDFLKGTRLFYTCHSLPQRYLCGDNEVEKRAAQYLIQYNDLQMIALHDDMAVELNQMFSINNTQVIRNGVDFHMFQNAGVTREQKRKELGIPGDVFVLGHVGRFADVKNHSFLADVFHVVAQRKPNAYLLMVGAQDSTEIEEKLNGFGLRDRYQILRNRADINEIMQAMNVFVFPSKYEGLGIALIEAQAAGLRCVASDAVPEEAFRTDRAVALPLGDPEQWADAILDPERKGEPHGALEDYDMNREIRKLERLYRGAR